MKLPLSWAALGSPAFAETLRQELHDRFFELPLDRINDGGGWPDTASIEVRVETIREEGERVYAGVSVRFSATNPSSCSPSGSDQQVQSTLTLSFDKKNARGAVQVVVPD